MTSVAKRRKVFLSIMGLSLASVLVAGCGSSEPNPNETEIILPGEIKEEGIENGGESFTDSNASGVSDTVGEADAIVQSFEDLADTSAEDEVPEGVDPDENYDKILERINSSVSTSIEANGVSYKIVSVDNVDVGPNKPVQIAIIPEGDPQQAVKFATPSVGSQSSGSGKVVSNDDLQETLNKTPQVECDKDSVLGSPLIVTCSFDKEISPNSSLLFGFIVSASDDGTEQNIELASIPLNPSSRGGN